MTVSGVIVASIEGGGSRGRLNAIVNGQRGTVCDDWASNALAAVVCRQLGFNTYNAILTSAKVGGTSLPIVLDDVICAGNEASLDECQYKTQHDCSHSEDLGVDCQIGYKGLNVRLVGNTTNLGRVEINYNNTWGTVCMSGFSRADAAVICEQLGFNGSLALIVSTAITGPGTGPIWLNNLQCTGSEANIASCRHDGYGIHSCNHGHDAGLFCPASAEASADVLQVRLVGSLPDRGRLEVKVFNQSWGTVCQYGFDAQDATVVCRMLGLPTAEASADVLQVRLVGSLPDRGRLEVKVFNQSWGTVCHLGFDAQVATVVCRMLGLPMSHAQAPVQKPALTYFRYGWWVPFPTEVDWRSRILISPGVQCVRMVLTPKMLPLSAECWGFPHIDECAVSTKNTCQQVCTNTGGSYVCSCHAGYTYYAANNTCVACADNQWGVNCSQTCDCGDRGTCHRVKGCVCHSDIDECAVSTKNTCQQVCTNTVGSYVCSCHAGYTYFAANNTCVDYTKYLEFGSQQGDITLTKGKQKLSAEIIIPSGLPIAGNIVHKVFVSMKGLVSFGRKYDSFNMRSLPVPGFHLMCAYWADLRLPFNDEANVWYQVYRRNEHNTAKELAMLTKGGQRVKQYANTDSYLPVVMLVVTFEKVPLGGVSTDTAERVNFQMVVVSDGFTTYGIVIYPSGGMQVDSRLNRPVTIGYLNRTLSEVTSPDTLTGNTDHEGVWFYPLSTQVENAAQKCMNWYFGERSQVTLQSVKSYITAILSLAPCPCIKILANISTTLLPEDVIGDVACFLTTSTSTKTPYAQRCCYNQTKGDFIQTRPLAGSFLLYHPKVNPSGHSLMDIRPKEHCCQHSRLCDKYYEVRPISTCQSVLVIQCMGTGDPHLTTLDGKTFSFNAVGEFTLLKFQQPGFELQARTCVATSSKGTSVAASVFCAFAAKGSNSTFQVEMNKNKTGLNVVVNRQDLTRKFQTDASFSHTFSGLSVFRTQAGAVKAFFTEGVGLTVSVKNRQLTIEVGVYVNTSGLPPPTGLLGNLNGNADDDFIFPNGTTLPSNTSEQDLLGYGKTWAVTDDNSLFMYEGGWGTSRYTNDTFQPLFLSDIPNLGTYGRWVVTDDNSLFMYEGGWGTSRYTNDSFQPLFLSEIPNQKLAEAQRECGGAEDLSCIYDFVTTDDKDLAAGTKSANDRLKVNIEMAG
ncbi:hypothetical protein ACOMHN_038986 [Nucella lapillus]